MRRPGHRGNSCRPPDQRDHTGGAIEVGIRVASRGKRRLDLIDQLFRPVGADQGGADDPGLFLPGGAEVGVSTGLRHGRRDPRQRVVFLLGKPGVDGEDEVGTGRGHLLKVDPLGVEDGGLSIAEQVLRPRPHAVGLVAEPVDQRNRSDPEREHRVVIGEPDGDDALG